MLIWRNEYAILQEKNTFSKRPAGRQVKKFNCRAKKIISTKDLKQAAKDVSPFLFHSQQATWILQLPEFIDGIGE